MSPSIENDSFVLVKNINKNFKLNKIFILKHPVYGMLAKMLVEIDPLKIFWFKGLNFTSISKKEIGPIKEEHVLGQIVLSFSKSKFKFHL